MSGPRHPRSRAAVEKVRRAVRAALDAAGVRPGDRIVVGCSHGPDSLALADALLDLCARASGREAIPVTLVYVDHGLRPEAAEEAHRVERFAHEHGAGFQRIAVGIDRSRGCGPEEAARAARHAALEDVADGLGARWVALGHTASDQAETVLLRLVRGAGVTGLAGIPPVRGRVLRPLLELDRGDVEAYLAARGLTPSLDASNLDPAFTRNRVRHELLPALRRENPAVDAALVRAARSLREQADALAWGAAHAHAALAPRWLDDEVRVSAPALAALPGAIAKRVLAELACSLGGSLEARHLDAIWTLAQPPAAGTRALDLPGLRVLREYDDLVLASGSARPLAEPEVRVEGGDPPYRVRRWRPGDRMRPAGAPGTRKLQDLFTDRKVPRSLRGDARVVERLSDGTIVWAEHVGPAAGADVRVTLTRPEGKAIYARCAPYPPTSASPEDRVDRGAADAAATPGRDANARRRPEAGSRGARGDGDLRSGDDGSRKEAGRSPVREP